MTSAAPKNNVMTTFGLIGKFQSVCARKTRRWSVSNLYVAQTFLSASQRDMLVPGFPGCGTGDGKFARTRRLESLRYIFSVYALIPIPDNNRHISQTVGPRCCAASIPGGAAAPPYHNQSHQAMEPMAAATSQMSSTARVRLRPVRTSR